MAESIFGDKANPPDEAALADALKDRKTLWDQILALCGGSGEWKFYTKAAGWTYPVKLGKRTLFYMLPKAGCIRLTFVYGPRAVEAAGSAGLPAQVLSDLLQATPYVEGRSVAISVTTAADIDTVQKLLRLKLEY